MILPFRRDVLRERTERDDTDDLLLARAELPSQRLLLAIELSDLTREMAEAARAHWTHSLPDDLGQKARLYATPLRIISGNARCIPR